MATITKPAAMKFRRVQATYSKKVARVRSPFTEQAETQIWPGENYRFTVEIVALKQADGIVAMKFLRDLALADNQFVHNVTNYVSADVSDRATMPLRLVAHTVTTDIDEGFFYRISFEVERVQ